MSPSEIITASIAGVALLVAWVARLDSKRSAEAAQKSAEAAQRANDLMARQLELATNQHTRELEKEIAESQPLLIWRGGASSGPTCEREFENVGGEVRDLAIQTTNGLSASVSPKAFVSHNGQGKVSFKGQWTWPILFTLECTTKRGERWRKSYKMTNLNEMAEA